MQRFDTFVGALRYEFRMQIRRRSVWITFIALGLFFIVFHQPWYRPITTPAGDALVYWTGEVQSPGHIARRAWRKGLREIPGQHPCHPCPHVRSLLRWRRVHHLALARCTGASYRPGDLCGHRASRHSVYRSIFHCLSCHSLGAALPVSLRRLLVLGQLASQFRHPDPERDDPYSRRRIHVYRVLQPGRTRGRVFSGNPGRNGPPGS